MTAHPTLTATDEQGVRAWVQHIAYIAQVVGDSERAHGDEDGLYQSVLVAIASGSPNPSGLAREALKAADIDYERWYA